MKITRYVKFEYVLQFTVHRSTEEANKLVITNLPKVDNVRKYLDQKVVTVDFGVCLKCFNVIKTERSHVNVDPNKHNIVLTF